MIEDGFVFRRLSARKFNLSSYRKISSPALIFQENNVHSILRRMIAGWLGWLPTLVGVLTQSACLLLLFGALTSYAAPPFPPDIKKIKDRGKIIVAQCSVLQPGFYWFDDDGSHQSEPSFLFRGKRLVGLDITMAMKIAESLGVDLELNQSSCDFNAVCLQVARGEADIGISKLSITLERAQYVRFTRPYAQLGVGLLVNRFLEARSGSKGSLLDVCNRPDTKIGVWKGTSWETYAQEMFPKADIQAYDSFDAAIQAVVDKKIYACLDEDFSLRLKLHQEPKAALWVRFVQVPEKKDPIGIAVAPNSPNLLAFLNLFLEHSDMKFDMEALLRKTSKIRLNRLDNSGIRLPK
jgi:ABC-type amino acid transport substrate-binding protein